MDNLKDRIINIINDDLSTKKLDIQRYEGDIHYICENINDNGNIIKSFLQSIRVSYNNKQNSSKVINNTIYGYTGFKGSRFYSPNIAESVTTSGAELTIGMSEFLENKLHINVIYSDTDSLFLSLSDIVEKELGNEQDIDKVREFIIDYIGNIYTKIDEFIYEIMKLFVGKKYKNTPKFEFKQEIIAEKGIFLKGKDNDSAKKKYILRIIDEEGVKKNELFFRGIDIRKAELSKDIKGLMRDVISEVMFADNITDKVLEQTTNKFLTSINVIKDWINTIDIDKIAEYKNISKNINEYKTDTLNKRALIIYNFFAEKYRLPKYEGMVKVKIVYVQPAIPLSQETQELMSIVNKIDVIGIPTEAVISQELIRDLFTKHLKIDTDTVITKMFVSRLETFFRTLDIDIKHYINQKQDRGRNVF